MPPMPDGCKEGILKGLYKFRASQKDDADARVQLLGSGAILNETLKAKDILEGDYNISADVWSVTSYKELHTDALDAERWNMFHPGEDPRVPYITETLQSETGSIFVAASDYMKALPESVASWIPGRLVALGTDGFGRSESREDLRDFFEVDAKHIVLAALYGLSREGEVEPKLVQQAIQDLKINPEKANPRIT